jgi:hypothetical protein
MFRLKNMLCLVAILSVISSSLKSQSYFVDKSGVLRSSKDKKEVSFFGVNYTLPFAHAYRMHKQLGIDLKEAIDRDVYHFARLGFDAYRIHVWDVEISDEEGNLIANEHLELLDYLSYCLKKRGIKIVYTPIAFWGNGYPEQNEPLPGFSSRWSKCEMTSAEEAIRVQEKYLSQFAEHTNPYTGLKIKDDPDVVGFEINNEPCNSTPPEQTTAFVKRMIQAIRGAKCKKPVFYNVSHNFQNTQAFYNSGIDGGTFQWYPSGLVAGHTRQGNFLPAVERYNIPFDTIRGYKNKARIVYEFDPADIADPYIYPAMARTFRSAGFQWITQFAYDPMAIAWANTEYQTHYLNLAYTPGKAISMKIAAEVARSIPRFADYGPYPKDTLFGNFRVSYREKLSVMNAPEKFFYSNNTSDQPVDIRMLREIAGCGASPVVSYPGTGAYFLDKLADGIWRLEVMPDAVWIKDPFAKASIKKEVALTSDNEWPMQINIPDLGEGFSSKGLNAGNARKASADRLTLNVRPGVYLLTRKDVDGDSWSAASPYGNILLGEYAAPQKKVSTFHVIHKPSVAITAGKEHIIAAHVIGAEKTDSIQLLYYYTDRQWDVKHVNLEAVKGYIYQAKIPADRIASGQLQYMIIVRKGEKSYTFPASAEGNPADWDYYDYSVWSVRVEPPEQYISLYNTQQEYDRMEVFVVHNNGYHKSLRTGESPGQVYTQVTAHSLKADNELLVRHYIKENISGRLDDINGCKELYLKSGQIHGIDSLHIGFITTDGATYKKQVPARPGIIRIPLPELSPTHTILQPQAYPAFLPVYFEPQNNIPFNKAEIEFVEISTGQNHTVENLVIEIESIWMK